MSSNRIRTAIAGILFGSMLGGLAPTHAIAGLVNELETDRSVLKHIPGERLVLRARFDAPKTGDLYLAIMLDNILLFLNADNVLTLNPAPHLYLQNFTGTKILLDMDAQQIPRGTYPLYQVVTIPDGNLLNLNDWLGGAEGLSALNFMVAQPVEVSHDYNNDGFPDDDLNRDGFHDDAEGLAAFIVSNINDNGAGSLREAIDNAQSGDTIKFDSSLANQTITLTSGQLTVDKDLIIDGGDAAGLTISGNNASRIIFVPYLEVTKNITLRNLIFANGFTQERGGAIETERQINLNIENSQFQNNIAGSGGAIETGAKSTLIVTNSKFDNNQAKPQNANTITPWDGAGAIRVHSLSNLTVKNSEFTNNKGTAGGAINSLGGNLIIEGSTFVNNDSTSGRLLGNFGQGGAILTDGASLNDNGTTSGEIIIRDSIFYGNKAVGGGGAGFLYGYSPDRIIIEGSAFVNNSVVDNDSGENGLGGAIRHGGSELAIKNTTFANNIAMRQGGGVWTDDSPLSISNSTFSGNQAFRPPEVNSGFAGGGGAMAFSGSAEIVNTTIANNYAGLIGGGIFGGDQATVKNTIFYNNEAGNGLIQHHTTAELNDIGGNIQYPNKETSNDPNDNNATANISIIDPKLGPLQEINGSLIHPLLEGSPAINAGTSTNAPTTDQLGQSRVDQVDIGAYEFTDTTHY